MALLGKGVAAIWHNVAPEFQADYNHWHCHEHVPERVGIPGFLRGRRYVAIEGEPEFFHFYETDGLDTLTSTAYLERLNNPTEWTRRVGVNIKDNNRTLSQVATSIGIGGGAAILTGRLQAAPGQDAALSNWLSNEVLPSLVGQPGIVAGHLLQGDHASSATETAEKAMRDRPDDVADWVLFLEAIEVEPLDPLWKGGALSEASLMQHGATRAALGTYRLHYALSNEDLG
ncbi:MAG: hypothetical protein HOL85_06290 [Rhodospirillaceae bacterium]|nr:hypothetical protein [Rhodospirillaceae bacterium]MBT6136669.1 hypothetical protein [Rhodospirillaceae bacterium]